MTENYEAHYSKNGEFLFVLECSMKNRPANPKCPLCGRNKTQISYSELSITSYVRGDGLVKDKAGALRDMNRYKLMNGEDPYEQYRVPGEKDHLIDKFRRGGIIIDNKGGKTNKINKINRIRNEAYDLPKSVRNIIIYLDKNRTATTEELSKFDDDINKILTEYKGTYFFNNGDTWMPMSICGRLVEELSEA
jgi:hypothetical protein